MLPPVLLVPVTHARPTNSPSQPVALDASLTLLLSLTRSSSFVVRHPAVVYLLASSALATVSLIENQPWYLLVQLMLA